MANIIERKVYSQDQLPEKLDEIIRDIRTVYEPNTVILYGSAAHGLPWHDLDLLVVVETNDPYYERVRKIARAKQSWTATDIMVVTPGELQLAIDENRFFVVQEILKKGKTVYGRGRSGGMVSVRER